MSEHLLHNTAHVMDMDQLQEALASTPSLIGKYGLQFEDGNRLISIPAEFALGGSNAVADALAQMIANEELRAHR